MTGRDTEIVRHISEDDLDRLLTQTDGEKVSKRLTFITRLYNDATLATVAEDVCVSQGTVSNWVTRWNEGGLGKLTPNFGSGLPPKLNETEQQQLLERLCEDQPWKNQEIQYLLDEEFELEYHPNYLPTFLDEVGLHYAIPRTKYGLIDQRTLRRSSTNASSTRSTRTLTMIRITSARMTKKTKSGKLTIIFAPTAAL